MMDKDDLRRESLREGLKVKGRSRRKAAARGAEAFGGLMTAGGRKLVTTLR
jgi:hypothetical protein